MEYKKGVMPISTSVNKTVKRALYIPEGITLKITLALQVCISWTEVLEWIQSPVVDH